MAYIKDASALDMSKHGVVLTIDADGHVEVVHLPGMKPNMRVATVSEASQWGFESYEQMNEREFARAAAKSHEPSNRSAGKFQPVNMTTDAQRTNSLRERAARVVGVARNERIAADMKAASAEQWRKRI